MNELSQLDHKKIIKLLHVLDDYLLSDYTYGKKKQLR